MNKLSTSFPATMKVPNVVVLLAVFNGTPWLAEQVESILNQVQVNVSIFVSVDVSSDQSENFIDEWASRESRIKVLMHGQKFGGAAPNFFRLFKDVDLSTCDYVSLADQDDIWESNKLNAAIEILKSSNCDAYSSNAVAFWENGKTAFINKSQPQMKWDYFFEAAGPGCTYVITKKLAFNIRNFLIKNSEVSKMIGLHDWFIYAIARAKGYRWIIDKSSWIYYRQHANNQVGMNMGWSAFIHRFRKVSSGWALSQSILMANILNMTSNPFVNIWISGKPLGLITLSFQSWQCRRKLKDKVLFFFSCLYMAIMGGLNL